jgi:predicted RNA-binding Zn-ribbon protein involved in translation (DUF1610 family)
MMDFSRLAMRWPFSRAETLGKAMPKSPPEPFAQRPCPICGRHTWQRLIEVRRDHLTYWCGECLIPHDVEP